MSCELRLVLAVLATSATVAAQPAPLVVPYNPPAVSDPTHRGLTLEVGLGGGSTTVEESVRSGSFAIGLWATRELAITFRATIAGRTTFVGASAQFYATGRVWIGAGVGQVSEKPPLDDYYSDPVRGAGGFGRLGVNLGASGRNAFYAAGEVQGGELENRSVVAGVVQLGYQLL